MSGCYNTHDNEMRAIVYVLTEKSPCRPGDFFNYLFDKITKPKSQITNKIQIKIFNR